MEIIYLKSGGGKKTNQVILDRDKLTKIISRVLNNTQEIRLELLFLSGSTSKRPGGDKFKRDPEKSWKMVDFLHEEINVEIGSLLRAMVVK